MLGKKQSQKLLPWVSKNFINNAVVYCLNVLLIFGMFIAFVWLNCTGTDKLAEFSAYFSDYKQPISFLILVGLSAGIMWLYLFYEDRNFLKNAVNSEMIFLIIEILLVVCFVVSRYINIYFRPLASVTLLVLFLTNKRTAMFVNGLFCIILLLMDVFSGSTVQVQTYLSFIVGFSSGFMAIFFTRHVYSRGGLLARGMFMSIPSVLCAVLMVIKDSGGVDFVLSLAYAIGSGVFSVACFMLLLPIFENLFKKVSPFKLAELTNHKARLIRRMITEAPGTFNHSIVVSNIAESCAVAIGEDALLARTCAYYHDIGKLRRPEFFGENQVDKVNPHNDLTPELSTTIIKSHTQDGYNFALKNGLPQEIADICIQHHGTMPIWFFYDKAKKFTDGEVDLAQYCYPGPKPQTKIAAIIMIADGAEASVRTLKDRSIENVKKAVQKIVDERMELGQFAECEITIKELNIIINAVVNNITGIYHHRIEYPKISLREKKRKM